MGIKHDREPAACRPPSCWRLKRTCDECPWRSDVPVGRFSPQRFLRLRKTVEQAFGPLFACHKSQEGGEAVCVGYLLRDGENNFVVRLAISRGDCDPSELEATGPLYENFEQMAKANGVRQPPRPPRRGLP